MNDSERVSTRAKREMEMSGSEWGMSDSESDLSISDEARETWANFEKSTFYTSKELRDLARASLEIADWMDKKKEEWNRNER